MNTLLRLAAAVLLVAGATTSAGAQPKKVELKPIDVQASMGGDPAAMGKFLLLRDKGVQKDLKLSDEQTKMVEELEKAKGNADKNPAMFKQFTDSVAKAVDEMKLTKEQSKRLDELLLQAKGPAVFLEPGVQKELSLAPDQTAKIPQTVLNELPKLFPKSVDVQGKTPEEFKKKMSDAYKAGTAAVLKTLSADQQAKWKMMIGTAYEGALPIVPPVVGGMPGLQPPPPPPLPPVKQ
jgi:hypothetical protein